MYSFTFPKGFLLYSSIYGCSCHISLSTSQWETEGTLTLVSSEKNLIMNCLQTWEQGLGKPQRTVQYYRAMQSRCHHKSEGVERGGESGDRGGCVKWTFPQDPWPWAKPAHGNPSAMVINTTPFVASLFLLQRPFLKDLVSFWTDGVCPTLKSLKGCLWKLFLTSSWELKFETICVNMT